MCVISTNLIVILLLHLGNGKEIVINDVTLVAGGKICRCYSDETNGYWTGGNCDECVPGFLKPTCTECESGQYSVHLYFVALVKHSLVFSQHLKQGSQTGGRARIPGDPWGPSCNSRGPMGGTM